MKERNGKRKYMQYGKHLAAVFVLAMAFCLGSLSGGGQKTAQAITRAQVNKKIVALKKQVKSLEKKVAAAKKKEKKETKGTVLIMGKIISWSPFIVQDGFLKRGSYFWVEKSENMTRLITQTLGDVKLTGKYRTYNGITCEVCRAVKTSSKSAGYKKQLAKKKKQLRDYQNSLKEQIVLKETNLGVGKKGKVNSSWKYSGKYNKVTWKTSDSKVVKIDSHGKMTGIKQGRAVVTAVCSLSKKKSKCTVIVRDYFSVYNAATGEEIDFDDEIETQENTLQLRCEFSSKSTKDTFTYECKNKDGKATISEDGLITFSKYGTVKITVSSSYVYQDFTVTYVEPEEEGELEEEQEDPWEEEADPWEEDYEEEEDEYYMSKY